jgi:hypothetical protein
MGCVLGIVSLNIFYYDLKNEFLSLVVVVVQQLVVFVVLVVHQYEIH